MRFLARSNEEVAEFLRERPKLHLHISGNEFGDNLLETISIFKLDSVLIYEPEEMILSVQAGITLKELESILFSKGQWIPTLVASESLETTLGAAVAMDDYHPRTKTCGALRTTILGGTFCTTNGEIFKSGSRVVKSVAGYDIHRAFCGSRGRFGIILELTLKVQPLPKMFYRFNTPDGSVAELTRLHPTCLEHNHNGFLVEFAGNTEDLTQDINLLLSSNIEIRELSNQDFAEEMKELIRSRAMKTEMYPESIEQLNRVRRVFDPEGVLH